MLAAKIKYLPDEIQLEMKHLKNSGFKRTLRLNPSQPFLTTKMSSVFIKIKFYEAVFFIGCVLAA